MRKRARVDANQKKIVSKIREAGCSVLHTHQLGKGAPDIIVGYAGNNYLIEIKDGDKPLAQQKLTPDEIKFQAEDGIRDFCLSRGLGDVYKRQSIQKAHYHFYLQMFHHL